MTPGGAGRSDQDRTPGGGGAVALAGPRGGAGRGHPPPLPAAPRSAGGAGEAVEAVGDRQAAVLAEGAAGHLGAGRRLYSAPSTIRSTRSTMAGSKPSATISSALASSSM